MLGYENQPHQKTMGVVSTARAQDRQPRQRKPDCQHFSMGEIRTTRATEPRHPEARSCGPPSMRAIAGVHIIVRRTQACSGMEPCAAPLVQNRAPSGCGSVWWD